MRKKLTLDQAQRRCKHIIDVVENEAICSDGKVCKYSKMLKKKDLLICLKKDELDEVKENEKIKK